MDITLGKIVGVYGVKGWVKVFSESRPREQIFEYSPWILELDGKRSEINVLQGRVHGKGLIAQLEGIEHRDLAEKLTGAVISVAEQALPETDKDEYYWSQLTGLCVVNTEGTVLGEVTGLLETGANDVMVVRGDKERLIPFTRYAVIQVDLDGRLITVDWDPEF
jgi:16S rRNA processing protein RimM